MGKRITRPVYYDSHDGNKRRIFDRVYEDGHAEGANFKNGRELVFVPEEQLIRVIEETAELPTISNEQE